MSDSEIYQVYKDLISTGDLKTMFPNLTGDWAQDKRAFMEIQRGFSDDDLIGGDDDLSDI